MRLNFENDRGTYLFQANTKHPLFQEVHRLLMKHIGLDRVVEHEIERLGKVERVYLAGKFANGLDCTIIDLLWSRD